MLTTSAFEEMRKSEAAGRANWSGGLREAPHQMMRRMTLPSANLVSSHDGACRRECTPTRA